MKIFFKDKELRLKNLPILPSNDFIAAPTAVSSCIIFRPLVKVLLFTIISKFNAFCSSTLSMAV